MNYAFHLHKKHKFKKYLKKISFKKINQFFLDISLFDSEICDLTEYFVFYWVNSLFFIIFFRNSF